MNCPHCRKPLAAGARFCGSCGQRIDSAPAALAPSPVLQPALVAAPAAAQYSSAPDRHATAIPGLLGRIRNMILTPRSEWPVIEPERTTALQLYTGYIVPLTAFAALLGFVHVSLIGVRLPFGAGILRSPMAVGLTSAVLTLVVGLVSLFVVGLIINGLAPTFGGTRDQRQALKVAAYSFTPGWLSALLALSPVLPTLLQFLATCYGIYVLYLGLPVLMRAPRERATGYTASVVACCILFGVLLAVAAGLFGHFGARAGLLPAQTPEQAQERSAHEVGNVIGNVLGTDEQGKAGLGAALSNLARAGAAQQTSPTAAPADAGSPAATTATQNPLGAAGGLLSALGGSLGGPNRVEPVDFKTLSTLLPSSVAGLKRSNVKGEGKQAIGVKTTSALADYAGGSGTAHVEIADVSGVSGLMDLANGLVQSETSQSDAGYEKDVVIGGRTAHEKYDAQARKGEISMIVARRFSVEVTGEGVPMSALEQAYGDINLGALEGMKDQGAQH